MADFSLLTNAAPLMKRYYDDRRVYSMAYKNRPLYAWIPKKTGVVGEASGYNVPLTIDDIPGESAQFGSAATARDGDSHEVWQLNRIKRYATATLDWETIRAMSNDMGSFMRAVKPRINSAINQLANSTAWGLYHDGTGVRGVIGTSGISAGVDGTFTLTNAADARSFGLRRTIVAAAAASGGALRVGSTKVTGIDIANGVITVADTGDIAAVEDTDFLFMLGDHAASGVTLRNVDGMVSWSPASTPSAGVLFKGVERAKFPEKLLLLKQAITFGASDGDLAAGIRLAAANVQANEGSPDALFVGPIMWAAIESDLASQSRYEMMMGSDARTGFDSIVINAGGGKINVVADPWCPETKGYMLQRDTWEMFSIDRFPDFVSDDGNRLHRMEDADSVEFRMGGYYNTLCRAPGHNIELTFTPSS
jgi:hypothetical protein